MDGRVNFTMLIRDADGSAVAEIIDNEWHVNPGRGFDRNYSDDALEVRDGTGDVILQVRALPDRIQLQGRLYDRTGHGMAFVKSPDPDRPGALMIPLGPGRPPLALRRCFDTRARCTSVNSSIEGRAKLTPSLSAGFERATARSCHLPQMHLAAQGCAQRQVAGQASQDMESASVPQDSAEIT